MGKGLGSLRGLVTAYICLLLLMGSFLLHSNSFLFDRTISSELSADFLLRFGIFWFVSFVLALIFFLTHIHLQKYTLTHVEMEQSAKVCKLTFIAGLCMSVVAGGLYYSLFYVL